MRITTTKKLKGVLELPSVKMQLSYDHQKNKPQVATVNDSNYKNNDIRVAVGMSLITLSDLPTDEQIQEQEESGQMQQMIRLTNKTNSLLYVEISDREKAKEIPAHGSIYVPMIAVQSAHVRKALENGILESEELGNLFSDPTDIEDLEIDATTPMVVNPNEEAMPVTEHTIKSNEVKDTATIKPEKDTSKVKVYSPSDIIDTEAEDEDTDVSFVDKEQEKERISFKRGKKSKKDDNISKTETVKKAKMDGTTPIVVQRSAKKTTKTKTASKKDMFTTTSDDTKSTIPSVTITSENPVDTTLPQTEGTIKEGKVFDL